MARALHIDEKFSHQHRLMNCQIRMADMAQSLLGSGWMLRLRVSGASMKPLLRSGSLIRIAPLSPSSGAPAVGDIVLFRAKGGRLIAHRVIGIDGDDYRTKGDSSGEPDDRVEHPQILGKVLGLEGPFFLPLGGPLARRIGLFLNRHYPRLVRVKSALRARWARTSSRLARERS